MTEALIEAGPLGLFLVSFLAATLLPFSSEVALVTALAAGVPIVPALVAASLGNSLACVVNWGLGSFARSTMQERIQAARSGRAALRAMDRWGSWSLALSWAPFVGDPLTIVAGLARVPFGLFVAVVIPLRVGRYLLIAGLL